MAIIHRKIGDLVGKAESSKKYAACVDVCYFCPYDCTNYSSPPPPPPPTTSTSHRHLTTGFILMIGVLGVVFILFCHVIILRYRSTQRNSRRMNQPPLENDGSDENQGPAMDHHVWYIRTVGLPQSMIDSIPVFDYRRGEKMIEGSDHCSVCLSEFQENESLRLLPKCSHAFHVLCIDTWLRSHKNCPICRSPVSTNNANTSVDNSVDMGSSHSRSTGGPGFETNEATDTRGVDETRGQSCVGGDHKMAQLLSKKRAFRVLSDVGDRRVGMNRELERVRRSVSMDYSSDSLVEIHVNKSNEGCSDT